MLRLRLITGPLLILLLLGLVWLDDRIGSVRLPIGGETHLEGPILALLALAVLPLAAVELARVTRASGMAARTWLTTIAGATGMLTLLAASLFSDPMLSAILPMTGAGAIFMAAIIIFSRHQNVTGVLAAAGGTMLAFVYLGAFLGFFLALRQMHAAWLIVGIILTTKSCDIGAYFTGTAIGRTKLIPWLSPGKTREGLVGGLITAGLVGGLLAWLGGEFALGRPLSFAAGALIGALFGAVGQIGDLIMSLFKRGAGLKDASRILPGMGGVMDVLDSPLLVAPVAFWTFRLLAA